MAVFEQSDDISWTANRNPLVLLAQVHSNSAHSHLLRIFLCVPSSMRVANDQSRERVVDGKKDHRCKRAHRRNRSVLVRHPHSTDQVSPMHDS